MTIYFAEMGDWIKIGYTQPKDASKRIAQLQTGQPQKIKLLGTIPGERDAEAGLHAEFASSRENGEWFCREEIITPVMFLIENQHPWYFCREKAISISWERAFRIPPGTDTSAYDAPEVPMPAPVGDAILGRAASIRIRAHRATHGKDLEWEANLCENMSKRRKRISSRHPYIMAWNELCQNQNSAVE